MDADKLNRWMTLGANIGVFAGLIFLAVEVRQNTDSLEESRDQATFQAYQGYLQNLDEATRALADSPNMPEIFVKWRNEGLDALTDVEMQRFIWQSSTGMTRLNTMHYLHEHGYHDEEIYTTMFPKLVCDNAPRWKAIGIWSTRPTYRAAVENIVAATCP